MLTVMDKVLSRSRKIWIWFQNPRDCGLEWIKPFWYWASMKLWSQYISHSFEMLRVSGWASHFSFNWFCNMLWRRKEEGDVYYYSLFCLPPVREKKSRIWKVFAWQQINLHRQVLQTFTNQQFSCMNINQQFCYINIAQLCNVDCIQRYFPYDEQTYWWAKTLSKKWTVLNFSRKLIIQLSQNTTTMASCGWREPAPFVPYGHATLSPFSYLEQLYDSLLWIALASDLTYDWFYLFYG